MSFDITKLITIAENERDIKTTVDATAYAISDKVFKPNLFNNKELITYHRYNADSSYIKPTETGFTFVATDGSLAETHMYVHLGYAKDYIGKTLTISSTSVETLNNIFYLTVKHNTNNTEYLNGKQFVQDNLCYSTLNIPSNAAYTNELLCLRLKIIGIEKDYQRFYIDNLMFTETSYPCSYTPYGYREEVAFKDFPQKVDEVYNKGVQDDYDTFWDIFQQYGKRTFYSQGFAGYGWTKDNFKPKYPIVTSKAPNRSNGMFMYAENLTEIMIPLYFYDSTSNSTFHTCTRLIKIGDDTGGGIWQTRDRTDSNNFGSCSKLEEIRYIDYNEKGEYIPSEIGKSHNFAFCKVLSVASMINIIRHLVDYSVDSPGTYTLTLHADAWARLEASEKTPQSEGINFTGTWREYVSSIGWNT